MMDFHHRYYKINKTLLSMIGLWPYQSFRKRLCIMFIVIFAMCWYGMATALASVKRYLNGETIVDVVCIYTYSGVVLAQTMFAFGHMETMLQMLNRIIDDWQVWADDDEVMFLHLYANRGRKTTVVYAVMIFLTGIVFITEPVSHKIIDVLLKNGSEPGVFPVPVDFYFFDVQKYYFYTVMYSCVSIILILLLQVANDSMLYVNVQHCCGIFSAIAHKLERVANNAMDAEAEGTIHELEWKDSNFANLISCIGRHNDAIQYARLVNTNYTWCFFATVLLGVILITVLATQVILNVNDLQVIIKFIIWTITATSVFYFYSHTGQNLIDHSIIVNDCIHKGKWYCLSLRAQKLLLFMSMRSSVPCSLTVGRLFIMSLENFTTLMKTCMSFFTFLSSMRDH